MVIMLDNFKRSSK